MFYSLILKAQCRDGNCIEVFWHGDSVFVKFNGYIEQPGPTEMAEWVTWAMDLPHRQIEDHKTLTYIMEG